MSRHMNPFNHDHSFDLTDIRIFRQEYEDNFRRLKYFGLQYIQDEEVVADLIQDVWVRVWEKKEVFPNQFAFRRYLSQALYHAILNYLKHARIVTEYADQMQDQHNVEEEATVQLIKAEVYEMINSAFDELPNACRQVYAASLSGKTQREIAEELHISINTVKKHINNANHYLRKRLKHALLVFCNIISRFHFATLT